MVVTRLAFKLPPQSFSITPPAGPAAPFSPSSDWVEYDTGEYELRLYFTQSMNHASVPNLVDWLIEKTPGGWSIGDVSWEVEVNMILLDFTGPAGAVGTFDITYINNSNKLQLLDGTACRTTGPFTIDAG